MRLREYRVMTAHQLLDEFNKTKILLASFKDKCKDCYRKQFFKLENIKKEIRRRENI